MTTKRANNQTTQIQNWCGHVKPDDASLNVLFQRTHFNNIQVNTNIRVFAGAEDASVALDAKAPLMYYLELQTCRKKKSIVYTK